MDQPEMLFDYSSTSGSDEAAFAIALFFAFLGIFVFAFIVTYVIYAFLLSRIFKKAGIKETVAWIPFYNHWKLLELGGQQGVWAVLAIVPFVSIASWVFTYIAMYHVGLKLGKEGWFVLVAIFFPLVWFIWLGFDDSKWPKKAKTVKA
jgi:hypothetical protein